MCQLSVWKVQLYKSEAKDVLVITNIQTKLAHNANRQIPSKMLELWWPNLSCLIWGDGPQDRVRRPTADPSGSGDPISWAPRAALPHSSGRGGFSLNIPVNTSLRVENPWEWNAVGRWFTNCILMREKKCKKLKTRATVGVLFLY